MRKAQSLIDRLGFFKMAKPVARLLPLLLLSSCMGRDSDQLSSQSLNMKSLGLDTSKPAVVVFGAIWCHPCRAEVPTLNKAISEFGNQIQILGLLVEGDQKGFSSKASDLSSFKGFSGETPQYRLGLDSNWSLFDRLQPGQGRALPTIVFVQNNKIVKLIQRSLDYDLELRPLIKDLISGTVHREEKPEEPQPQKPEQQVLTLPIAEWSARPGNAPGGELYSAISSTLSQSRRPYGFSSIEMPMREGKLTFTPGKEGVLDVPISGNWEKQTERGYCTLTIFFNPNGSLLRHTGRCV